MDQPIKIITLPLSGATQEMMQKALHALSGIRRQFRKPANAGPSCPPFPGNTIYQLPSCAGSSILTSLASRCGRPEVGDWRVWVSDVEKYVLRVDPFEEKCELQISGSKPVRWRQILFSRSRICHIYHHLSRIQSSEIIHLSLIFLIVPKLSTFQ